MRPIYFPLDGILFRSMIQIKHSTLLCLPTSSLVRSALTKTLISTNRITVHWMRIIPCAVRIKAVWLSEILKSSLRTVPNISSHGKPIPPLPATVRAIVPPNRQLEGPFIFEKGVQKGKNSKGTSSKFVALYSKGSDLYIIIKGAAMRGRP